MPSVIDSFAAAVEQAITETALECEKRENPDPEAEARRAAAVNSAFDALMEQAVITLEQTDTHPDGSCPRHEVSIAARDGGKAYAMITWCEDQFDFWPDGKPEGDWRQGRIVWDPWGEPGTALFDRTERAIAERSA